MIDETTTLGFFYENWRVYQDRVREAIRPLTAAQLDLRAAPNLWHLGRIAAHINATRAGWFRLLGEGDPAFDAIADSDNLVPTPDAASLVAAMDATWELVEGSLTRWSPAEMAEVLVRRGNGWEGKITRNWVAWHVLEHDLHHGGEISLTLGMHGLAAPDI